ncbi:MAG: hypothetical protein ACI9MR_001729 [Myxococcota bacterium]|jgi:hypothetical protein
MLERLSGRWSGWLVAGVLALLTLWFWLLVLRLGTDKNFAIDEFQYAHASWLVSEGQVPYRDFFEVHFPLLYQLLSVVWWFGDDQPQHILWLRYAMIGVVSVTGFAMARVVVGGQTRSARAPWMWLIGPLLLFACLAYTTFATEIRNDPMAFMMLLGAMACLYRDRSTPISRRTQLRPIFAGLLFALACWGTQKMLYIGIPFVAALVADLTVNRRRGAGYLLINPARFLVGAALFVVPLVIYLLATGSFDDMWRWCFEWAAEYQTRYPGFSWVPGFERVLQDHWWYFALAAVGLATTIRRLYLTRPSGSSFDPDHLLVALWFSAFVSVAIQVAPWDYSFIPVMGLTAVFAGRGVLALVAGAQRLGDRESDPTSAAVFVLAALVLVGGLVLLRAHQKGVKRLSRTNAYQLEVLADIDRLTAPTDVAYDNSGGYVSRPHAYFYYQTFGGMRRHDRKQLATEIPVALRDSGAVLVMHDVRYGELPGSVKRTIEANFQKFSGDLWFHGWRLKRPIEKIHVNAAGAYFLTSDDPAVQARIKVDGTGFKDGTVALEPGEHTVTGTKGDRELYLLWLPRDGTRWKPKPRAKPRFSTLF